MTTKDLEQIRGILKEEIKTSVREEVDRGIKSALKPVNRRLKKIEHDIDFMLKYHDEMHIHLRKRVERLEEHTGLTQN